MWTPLDYVIGILLLIFLGGIIIIPAFDPWRPEDGKTYPNET